VSLPIYTRPDSSYYFAPPCPLSCHSTRLRCYQDSKTKSCYPLVNTRVVPAVTRASPCPSPAVDLFGAAHRREVPWHPLVPEHLQILCIGPDHYWRGLADDTHAARVLRQYRPHTSQHLCSPSFSSCSSHPQAQNHTSIFSGYIWLRIASIRAQNGDLSRSGAFAEDPKISL
jgi:hypothetical protein